MARFGALLRSIGRAVGDLSGNPLARLGVAQLGVGDADHRPEHGAYAQPACAKNTAGPWPRSSQ